MIRTSLQRSRELLIYRLVSSWGEACFNLISLVDLIRDDDNIRLVSELLTPEFGVELFGMLPRVKRLRDAAMAKLEELAEQQSRTKDESPSTKFDLF
ncbi:hypothetical protein SFA35_03395 [Pseudomonas sp. HR96]|uniref:hypothetical protein n=1 Tax=Pseudomonas sp. HR96 TaxID=1027966 RepID=UPI002A7637D1|nr:hypothetical protein [Pseudomonas sp. HR96]WPP00444.1 hypothetical protein SFA35_03395 [Pseudomonas sp. HR96]